MMRQGALENIVIYKERFNAAHKGYNDQGNPEMSKKGIAIDFFRGLDNARYAGFKKDISNSLTSKSIEQPENLNKMHLLANQWLTTTTKTHPSGLATTFTTTCDRQETPKRNSQDKKGEKGKRSEDKNKNDKDERDKKDKDLSHIECFRAGHYANNCPSRKKTNEDNDSEERSAHLTWNANMFGTYQVNNAVKAQEFGRNEVLIDNQANISVVHPSLLRDVQPADQTIKINGVGGHQLSVSETGYLDPLFRVYASEATHANILSLSEVEDQYLVTYEPQKNFIIHLPETDIVLNRKAGMYVADWDFTRTYLRLRLTRSTPRPKRRRPNRHTSYSERAVFLLLQRQYTFFKMAISRICRILRLKTYVEHMKSFVRHQSTYVVR